MELLQRYRIPALIATSIGILLFFYYQTGHKERLDQPSIVMPKEEAKENTHKKSIEEKVEEESKPQLVMIDVKGAVMRPGIYEATSNDRIYDIVQKAGGFRKEADQTKVNLAQKLQDEMVVYIPKVGEKEPTAISQRVPSAKPANSGNGQGEILVNINTATAEELQNLPGIGKTRAQSIIEYRETNGPFQKVEDLKNISGIGDKTYDKLKDKVTLK
ncbi:MAG: helix-hairpin-helix domain-containing protein [Bacillales bacterium]|nr:helix-hairpin-helix domain-containing protein [Bacillales bacterium]